jgi:hypothetical protein
MYGDKSVRNLEEDLAEGFREYVMTRQEKGILNKIKNFFKNLYIKIKYWSAFKPHIYSYYKNINKGRYANRALSENIVNALYSQEQYTQEMQEIKDKAIDDGTFMLAPNGKPTNLTERQWIHVRTKAFKEWFGDWINPYNRNINISLDIDKESADVDGFGSMIVIRLKDKNNSSKGKFIGTIPMQQQIKSTEDFKFTQYIDINSVAGYSYIEEEFRGKGFGKAAYWELGMWLSRNGSILRSATDNSRTEAATRVWKSLEKDGFAKKVEDIYEFVNNSSKVIDENGEPLVVYHHTDNANLTEFSTDFDNYFAKDGGTKEAIFFDEEKTGTLNRKYDKAFFLNIRDLNEYNETKK